MPRWTMGRTRSLALAAVAGVSIVAIGSVALPVSAQVPSAQHDHGQQAAPGSATSVDADIARLFTRIDQTTGDERMAVMTELITLLVQDRAARTGATAAAGAPAPMCAMCAEHKAAGGGQMCAMCAEHQSAGSGSMCAMCAANQSAGNGQTCAMCAAQHAGTNDQTASSAASASCCAGHK